MNQILTIVGLFCLSWWNVQASEGDTELLSRVRRVVGGGNALPAEYPWMGSLRSATDEHICGAILISETEAITAAHCNEDTSIVSIVLGEISLLSPNPTRRNVQFIAHPEFDPETLRNDIAVVRFTTPVQFNANIQPATIGTSRDERNTHSDCTITGWGLTNQAPPLGPQSPSILQVADANFYGPLECANGFEDPLFCGEVMLCGGNLNGGISTCMRDDGGPLQCINEATGQYEIIGITSFFFHRATGLCAQPNNPHVFTRVSSFLDFITQLRGNDAPVFECPNFQIFDLPDGRNVILYDTPPCTFIDGRTSTVSCTPPSLSPLTLPETVTCTCEDQFGTSLSRLCLAEVADPPPEITGACPTDIGFLPSPDGQRIITYTPPECIDGGDFLQVDCTPASSLTPVTSPRQIRCTCTDTAGKTVALTCPVETRLTVLPFPPTVIIVEGTATWTPPDCMLNGVLVGTAVCTPSSSDIRVTVTCVCTLGAQQDIRSFELFPLINNPPTPVCPDNVQLISSILTYTATCTDLEDGVIGVNQGLTCTPAPGTFQPALPAQIVCSCTDSGGLPTTIVCPVIPAINPPIIDQCPGNVQVISAGSQLFLTYSPASCTDPEDGQIIGPGLSCTPAQGSILTTAPSVITCTCTDSDGLTDTRACPGAVTDGCAVNRCQPPLECREAQGEPGYTCHSIVGQECP